MPESLKDTSFVGHVHILLLVELALQLSHLALRTVTIIELTWRDCKVLSDTLIDHLNCIYGAAIFLFHYYVLGILCWLSYAWCNFWVRMAV